MTLTDTKQLIEKAIAEGNNYAYAGDDKGLHEALLNGYTAKTIEEATLGIINDMWSQHRAKYDGLSDEEKVRLFNEYSRGNYGWESNHCWTWDLKQVLTESED